ncbi:MAG TPA: type II toxin-antitoxin system prevent-host-death family antitoxin [Aeromonadales bacterium]|nr:type II toxin-antitoxin system prevent-host-death family antitoxin [Aeromonadales bacterium]
MHKLSIDEVEGNLAKLIALVQKGDEVVFSEKNQPVVKLVICENIKGRRVAGLHQGEVHMSEDFDEPLDESYWMGEQ